MGENDLKIEKENFPDTKWKFSTKKFAYTYENFNCVDDHRKPVNSLRKEDFFNKLKNVYPNDMEIERTNESIKVFNTKNGKELTRLCSERDLLLLAFVFQKL